MRSHTKFFYYTAIFLGIVSLAVFSVFPPDSPIKAEAPDPAEKASEIIPPLSRTMQTENILTEFYREQDYELVWMRKNELTPMGEQLYSLLNQAGKRGLILDDYNVTEINGLWLSVRQQEYEHVDARHLAELDLKLSEGFLLLAGDLTSGQINRENKTRNYIPVNYEEELLNLLRRVVSTGQFYPHLQEIQPQHPYYWSLKRELRTLKDTGTENENRRKINELKINLERWRWLDRNPGDRHILVNQPSSHLDVFEGEERVISMKTIIGMPERPTPDISSRMTHLVLSPRWYIPESIAVQDHLPDIKEDIDYLDERNFQVYEREGDRFKTVDPEEIDWEEKGPDNFPYYLWQDAGPANALGRVVFRFPNQQHIYLHDTPDRHLFQEDNRSYSSGCVRLEKPMELTYYLLKDKENWHPARIQDKIEERDETQVNLSEPIDIHLTYFTAIPDYDSGEIKYYEDIYERNPELIDALNL